METRHSNPLNESQTPTTERLVEDFKAMVQRVEQRAVERAKAADEVIHAHPYRAVGVAVGVGLLMGALAGRRWHW